VPWEVWLLPLLYWLLFALALFLVMVCMMVILRRQWVENEKLLREAWRRCTRRP
jgi:hypothetical protein